MEKLKLWFWNILVAIDQFANSILGGDPDETISSRVAKRSREDCSVCYWLCRVLHWIDPNHCPDVLEADEGTRDVIK